MGHHHEIAVRYGEVDMQRVVFNAHYLAYVDDAMDHWMRELDGDFESLGWDFMLKRAEVDWHGSAGVGDLIEIESSIARWGTTSFVVDHQVHVDDRPVVSVLVTYVGVQAGTSTTAAPPARVRAHLGEPATSEG
ncbi:MAG: acyl-CoA thioesterase [Acidimicrobiales bacterium]